MPQNGVYDLLKMLEIALDEGYSVLKYTIVNKREIEDLIDRIYATLPPEVQEARVLLRDKERLINEARQKATRIVQEAQNEADRKLSESDQIKAIEREGIRIKNEVVDDCEKMKHLAIQDGENIRMKATEEALYAGIDKMRVGNVLDDISGAVEDVANSYKFGIVRQYGGHGVGHQMHEEPFLFNYRVGDNTLIKQGYAIAIEPMLNLGKDEVVVADDEWTVSTADGTPSAHFEHTVIATDEGPLITTKLISKEVS